MNSNNCGDRSFSDGATAALPGHCSHRHSATPGGATLPNWGRVRWWLFSVSLSLEISFPYCIGKFLLCLSLHHQETKVSIFSEVIDQLLSLRRRLFLDFFIHSLKTIIQPQETKSEAGASVLPKQRNKLRLGPAVSTATQPHHWSHFVSSALDCLGTSRDGRTETAEGRASWGELSL